MVEAVSHGGPSTTMKQYLVHFRQHWKYLDFARQELESLASMHGVSKDELFVRDPALLDMKVNPTVYINLPSDQVCKQILARSVLIKEIIDVFSEAQLTRRSRERSSEKVEGEAVAGGTEAQEGAVNPLQFNYELLVANVDQERLTPIISQSKKLKFDIEGVGRKINVKE